MAAAKKFLPAPIDRPLSKAYLRKFTGWSTSAPPGLSDPTSFREMHNCSLTLEGAVAIRPGMRRVFNAPADGEVVGSFEHFYSTDVGGNLVKAILFAVKNTTTNHVDFRVALEDATGFNVVEVADVFTVAPGEVLAYGAGTQPVPTYVSYVQIDNKILALSNNGEPFRLFTVGATRSASVIKTVTRPNYDVTDRPSLIKPDAGWIAGTQSTVPTEETTTASTLVSSDDTKNIFNFGYFYTFVNAVGESSPSMITVKRVQRRWTSWNVDTVDDKKSPDQLVAVIPQAAWDQAKTQGAVAWNLYFFTWSNQDAVPVEGVLIKTGSMESPYAQNGWQSHTPLVQGTDATKPLPSINRLDNFTEPSTAGNGIVAGDRMVLVYDLNNRARIKWSSNQQGDYLNFSSSKGGGYKTLTSGNLYTPAVVKLWQNPQSVDTLVVLCMGLDGYGSAYYMTPNSSITAQNQTAVVMGFEETTATPGTVSPYGCEVLNNALYHPLENNLMKSTAANYNINHALMADPIQNIWQQVTLDKKMKIVSSQMDSSLYYLIHSPVGLLPSTNEANQIWICDTSQKGSWSCWDVNGTSLKKLEFQGRLYMSVASGNALYIFDAEYDHDDVWDSGTASWKEVGIPWSVVTNTQGANRAHDAWAMLQQVNVTFGNFTGECVYGVRGKDVNGTPIEVSKHVVSPMKRKDPLDVFDNEDMLLVRRIMKEWEFFWRSADRPKNRSHGSVNFVQYRYTPASVNVGYEQGSIETFEYQQRDVSFANGVSIPMADTSKP